jgi:hypothetical protein
MIAEDTAFGASRALTVKCPRSRPPGDVGRVIASYGVDCMSAKQVSICASITPYYECNDFPEKEIVEDCRCCTKLAG